MARATESGTFNVTVPPPGRKTKTGTIQVLVQGARAIETGTITVTVGSVTVVAGPNQKVEAGAAFLLDPVENLNGSTIASRQWKIGATVVGTTKQLTGRAPITLHGQDVIYTYTVTDTGSNTASSQVVISALPAQIQAMGPDGVLYPAVRREQGP